MMDVRNRLVKLLGTMACGTIDIEGCDTCKYRYEYDCSACAYADYLIAHGVTVPEWISVKERLPQEKGEICKNVILFMDDGLVTVGWLNEDRRSAYMLDPRNDFISKVPISRCTHWMPLPTPPQEVAE